MVFVNMIFSIIFGNVVVFICLSMFFIFYYVLFESTVVLAKQKDYERLLSQPKLAQKRESAAAGTPVDSPAPSSDPKLAQARLHECMVTSKTL